MRCLEDKSESNKVCESSFSQTLTLPAFQRRMTAFPMEIFIICFWEEVECSEWSFAFLDCQQYFASDSKCVTVVQLAPSVIILIQWFSTSYATTL